MKQTSAPSASTVVKAAALLMAVPALLVPMKAAAQQMAAAGSPNLAACDAIQDPAKSAQCSHDTAMAILKQREKAAEARGAAADARTACWNEIGDLRGNAQFGAKATEIARELVKASGRPAVENDACVLRDGIRAGLVRMKLLPARVSLN